MTARIDGPDARAQHLDLPVVAKVHRASFDADDSRLRTSDQDDEDSDVTVPPLNGIPVHKNRHPSGKISDPAQAVRKRVKSFLLRGGVYSRTERLLRDSADWRGAALQMGVSAREFLPLVAESALSWITVVHNAPRQFIANTTVIHHNFAMTREDPQMKLRLPADLKERLAALAAQDGRSLNAELVKRLEESLEGEGNAGKWTVDDRTLDMFADSVADKVMKALDERGRGSSRR